MATNPAPTSTRPRPLRRGVRTAALALVLGLLTSLAVAATVAFSADPPSTPPNIMRSFMAHGQPWSISESSHFGARRALWSQLTFDSLYTPQDLKKRFPDGPPDDAALALTTLREMYEPLIAQRPGGRSFHAPARWGQFASGSTAPEPGMRGTDYGLGWPFTCLWYQVLGNDQGMTVVGAQLRGGLLISGQPATVGDAHCRIIPLRPAWPGLLGNTFIFAAAWLLVLLAVPMLVRARRRRRGLCPACAYDLRATPAGSPCPECGAIH
ncbi:MAG: hypothetical protein KF869_00205 [Phycisphaeraceae bacterium]|nr:hypothetical protein [Phycisphaeraceae bacterium]